MLDITYGRGTYSKKEFMEAILAEFLAQDAEIRKKYIALMINRLSKYGTNSRERTEYIKKWKHAHLNCS